MARNILKWQSWRLTNYIENSGNIVVSLTRPHSRILEKIGIDS